jgi:D-alanyl-D-alanine dipeptidase
VGPFKVTGIKPALDDLETIFAELKAAHPDLYKLIGTAGMTCYRCVRGAPGTPSNHAAGTALDVTIAGTLTLFNAKVVPSGLIVLYGYFHRHGWFWAAGYKGRTDPMHFEVSDERLQQWKKEGKI